MLVKSGEKLFLDSIQESERSPQKLGICKTAPKKSHKNSLTVSVETFAKFDLKKVELHESPKMEKVAMIFKTPVKAII